MPFTMIARTWQRADPFDSSQLTTASCSLIEKACGAYWRQAGTLIETAYANGTFQSDSIVIYCYESEPLLNNDMVRQGLMAVLDSSNKDDPNPANRHERDFLVVRDTVTPGSTPWIFIKPKHPWADVCSPGLSDMPNIPLVSPLQNHKILASGHDHPSSPNIPVTCKDSTGNPKADQNGTPLVFTTADGPTVADWIWLDTLNSSSANASYAAKGWLPMPEMVIDRMKLMMMRPGGTTGSEKALGNTFNHKFGKCAWPQRVI